MAALLAFVTLSTGIEVHPHREVLGAERTALGPRGETIALGASHPTSAPHVEATGTERTLRCPVCLLHLQSAGEAPGDAAAALRPALDGRPAAPSQAPPRSVPYLPGGSRAPPTSR